MLARNLPIALAALALAASPAAAQTVAPVAHVGCAYEVGCGGYPQPVGQYVRAVEDDGRYVALEDGSLWEVEISDRATTASWQADEFVILSWIATPRGDFAYLLSRVGDREQRAAVRLAGRRPGPAGGEHLDQE